MRHTLVSMDKVAVQNSRQGSKDMFGTLLVIIPTHLNAVCNDVELDLNVTGFQFGFKVFDTEPLTFIFRLCLLLCGILSRSAYWSVELTIAEDNRLGYGIMPVVLTLPFRTVQGRTTKRCINCLFVSL